MNVLVLSLTPYTPNFYNYLPKAHFSEADIDNGLYMQTVAGFSFL